MNSRTEPFVPLLPSAPLNNDGAEFQVTLLGQSDQAQSQPLPLPAARQSDPSTCQPRVTLHRDADRVTAIRVECACGQTIDLACLYEGAKP